MRLNSYTEMDYKLSYLRTKDDKEIDLILERPGSPDLLIEIKSYSSVETNDAKDLRAFVDAWDRPAEAMILSQDNRLLDILGVRCLPWREALPQIFKPQN
jgi:hypothetical protein